MEENMRRVGMDTLYLAGCALRGQIPERDISSDLNAVLEFCKFHSMTAVAAVALEARWKSREGDKPQILEQFSAELARSIRKNILLNAEREQITAYLEQIGCRYLVLKGSVLQHLYPRIGMRQMSDNDILVDPEYQEQIHRFMLDRNYTPVSYQITVENNYHKPPLYNFEIHTALFGMESAEVFHSYYAGVLDRLPGETGKQYGRVFAPEDFYIYLIAHAWKHACKSGVGIRLLADIRVFRSRYGQLDMAYVERELRKLGAAEFEYGCRCLSDKLLNADPEGQFLSTEEEQLLMQLFAAGTYGTEEGRMDNRLKHQTGLLAKLRYVLGRLFPSAQQLSLAYPKVMQQKWRVPLIWILRLVRAVFLRPAATVKELMMLIKKRGKK